MNPVKLYVCTYVEKLYMKKNTIDINKCKTIYYLDR